MCICVYKGSIHTDVCVYKKRFHTDVCVCVKRGRGCVRQREAQRKHLISISPACVQNNLPKASLELGFS